MYRNVAAVMLGLSLVFGSVANGQRLEATVYLPDTLTGDVEGACIAYNPDRNLCYVAGYGFAVAVLDGASGDKLAVFDAGHASYAACCNPASDKIYLAWTDDGLVGIVDGGSNRVIDSVQSGTDACPLLLCWNSTVNRTYVAWDDGLLSSIDGATNRVDATIDMGGFDIQAILCVPQANKVYCLSDGELSVIDCAADTLAARLSLDTMQYGVALAYNETSNRLYAVCEDGVLVVDPATDSVIKVIETAEYYATCSAVWNRPANRLYCLDEDGYLQVIDCTLDSVVDVAALPVYPPLPPEFSAMLSDPDRDKVYCLDYDGESGIVTWEGASRYVGQVPTGECPCALAIVPSSRRLLCVCDGLASVYVADTDSDSLVQTVLLSDPPSLMCASRDGSKLYAACSESGDLVVIDAAQNRVARRLLPGVFHRVLCYDPGRDRLYTVSSTRDSVYVVDCAADSAIARLPVGPYPYALSFNSVEDKLYCADRTADSIWVISGSTNEVLRTIPVGESPRLQCLSAVSNKLYVGNYTSENLTAIDCSTDSVVATVELGSHPAVLVYDSIDDRVFCAGDGHRDSLFVVDCRTDSVVGGFIVPAKPSALCYNPVGNKVYSAGTSGDSVLAVDANTFRVLNSFPCGNPRGLWYSRASDNVYCTNSAEGKVMVIDGTLDSLVTEVVVGDGPRLVTGSDVTNHIYVANYYGSSISVIRDFVPEDPVTSAHSRTMFTRELTLLGAEPAVLIDIAGRKVAQLQSGTNDLRQTRPGVYFVRRLSDTKSTKLVILR